MKIKNIEKEPLLTLTTPKGITVIIFEDVVEIDGLVISWDYLIRLAEGDEDE